MAYRYDKKLLQIGGNTKTKREKISDEERELRARRRRVSPLASIGFANSNG